MVITMAQLDTLKSHFAFLASSQGYISEDDYNAACHGITDEALLGELADWLLSKDYELKKGVGPQYQKEVQEKVKNPNVSDVKDTKHRTHKNKNKFQKSKKKADDEAEYALQEAVGKWMQEHLDEYVPRRGYDRPMPGDYTPYLSSPPDTLDDYISSFVSDASGEFGIDFSETEWVNLMAAELITEAMTLREEYDAEFGRKGSFHLNKVIEKMQEFEDEFFPAWKKWKASLNDNEEFLAVLASVELTAQDFSNYEQAQRSVLQLVESYANEIPEDAYISNTALQNEFLKIDPDAKLPINQRITNAISRIFDPNILAEIFSEIYRGVQSGFETQPRTPESQTPTTPAEPMPSGTRMIEFSGEPGPSSLETASMRVTPVIKAKVAKVVTTVARIGYADKERMKIKFDNGTSFSAYIAETPIQKAAGLEVFDSLESTEGLLFPFEEEGSVTFHMGSVKFPIDIVFLMDAPHGLEVGKVVANIQPGSLEWWSYPKTIAALEVVGGKCKECDIKVGSICTVSNRIVADIEDERDIIRDVDVDGYRLRMWDTYRTDRLGKSILGYEFFDRNGNLLFTGEDFSPSPMDAIDSDASVRALLGFLTLRPGDTDDEYFAEYTSEQMDFAQTDAEELQLYTLEEEEGYPAMKFEDWQRGKEE
jgi:uncharacterized membrane protein (UPF0127 family)